jgi:hypothetical protein
MWAERPLSKLNTNTKYISSRVEIMLNFILLELIEYFILLNNKKEKTKKLKIKIKSMILSK